MMLALTKTLFEVWNKEQIRYCVIRDSAYLREGLKGIGDIDVLVHPEDIEDAQRTLAESGFKTFMEPSEVMACHREDWIGFDDSTGRLKSIRLYQEIIIEGKNRGKFVFLARDIALRSRIRFEGTNIYVVEPHLETVMLYIQLARRLDMGDDDTLSWRALCGTASLCGRIRKEKMAALCSELFWGNGLLISDLIMNMVMREKAFKVNPPSSQELSSLMGKIERELKPIFYKVGNTEDGSRGTLSSLEEGKKVKSKEGISICFIGAEGTGKNKISDDIEKWLAERIGCKKFNLGDEDQYHSLLKKLTGSLNRIYRKSLQGGRSRETSAVALSVTDTGIIEQAEKDRETGIKEFVRYPLSMTIAYGHMRIAYHSLKTIEMAEDYRRKGGIVLFDSYPQIQAGGIYDGPNITEKFRNYLDRDVFKHLAERESDFLKRAALYSPSLVFRLVVSPEDALPLKLGHDYGIARRKAENTEKLVLKHSGDYIIKGTQTYDKELLEVKRIIWESLQSLS